MQIRNGYLLTVFIQMLWFGDDKRTKTYKRNLEKGAIKNKKKNKMFTFMIYSSNKADGTNLKADPL